MENTIEHLDQLVHQGDAIKIKDSFYLIKRNIISGLKAKNIHNVIHELINSCYSFQKMERTQKEVIINYLLEREALGSTCIGGGIGIPHAVIKNMTNQDQICFCIGTSCQGISCDSLDGKPTHLFFLVLTPESIFKTGSHLKVFSTIGVLAKNELLKSQIISADCCSDIFNRILRSL